MNRAADAMPDRLGPGRVRRRLLELAFVLVALVVLVLVGPGLGSLRSHIAQASPGFLANSVLSVSGAGGLALGAWALHRGGLSTEHIARRTVGFFFLTSLANVAGVILFAALYAIGLLQDDRDPTLTYGFGLAAGVATVIVLALPVLLTGKTLHYPKPKSGRIAANRDLRPLPPADRGNHRRRAHLSRELAVDAGAAWERRVRATAAGACPRIATRCDLFAAGRSGRGHAVSGARQLAGDRPASPT